MSPLPLGPFRGGLAEPAYTQHEETDTGQTNNGRSVPVQAGEKHTHCAIIRRRIQTGLARKCPLCCSAAQAQGDARTVHRQPGWTGWTPRPGLLPLPGHVSSLLSDKFQLPAARLLAFAQTQLALFCISWRGQVNFTYFKRRACPTNLVLNTSPTPLQLVPSQHEFLATDLLTPLQQEEPPAPSTPTQPGAQKIKCSFRMLLPVTCTRRRAGFLARLCHPRFLKVSSASCRCLALRLSVLRALF